MKIKTRIIETIEKDYILEPQDLKVIIDCLNYCHHRATKHKSPMCSIHEHIQRLRKEFGIIK